MGTKIESQLEELAKVGKELLAVAIPEYGRSWNWLEDDVRVYKANNSDHSAFQIDGFEVVYLSPIKYELEMRHLPNLASYIKRVKQETARIASLVDGKNEAELQAEKDKRLAILQQEIDELTNGNNKKESSNG